MRLRLLAGIAAATLLTVAPAFADDWVATKLRGTVLGLEDGAWQRLHRGDVVSDSRVIRTLRGGRVTFERGAEIIDLGGDTQVRIYDRTGRKFTTVMQDFGTVIVEAEAQALEHFSVATPQLAAVVKGTRFTVHSDDSGAEVTVERGRVAVKDSDTRQSTTVIAGQSATTSAGGPLTVSGRGDLPAVFDTRGQVVVPAVYADDDVLILDEAQVASDSKEAGKAVREAAKEARADARDAAREARSDGGNGNSGNGGGGGSQGNGNSGSGSSGNGNDGSGNSGTNGGGNSGNGSGNSGSGNSGNGNGGDGGNGHGKRD